MDNPYAQFGTVDDPGPALAPAASPAPTSSGQGPAPSPDNPYAQFGTVDGGPATGNADQSTDPSGTTWGNIGKNVLAGAGDMAYSTVQGLNDFLQPGQALERQYYQNQAANQGQDASQVMPSQTSQVKGILPAAVNPDLVPTNTGSERVARMVGAGAAGGVLMGGASSIPGMLSAAAKGSVAGLGAGVAQEAVPEPYKPAAGLVGGLAGGLVAEAPGLLANTVKKGAGLIPITQGQVETAAGRKLVGAAENPQTAIQAIGDTDNPQLVPGSQPTTGQLTGDRGILSLENAVSKQSPEPFVARREEQNAARTDALTGIQQEGDPAAVGSFFRSQLDDIDNQTQTALNAATNQAQQAAEGIGGKQPLEAVGSNLRAPVQAMDDAERARTKALFQAVDPDGTAGVISAPLQNTVKSVYGNLSPAAQIGVTPAEKAISDVIGQYGQTMPFSHLGDIRSEISTAMRDAGVGTPAYGRLAQLRGGIESTIDHSLDTIGQQQAAQVSAGTLAPEDTILARIQSKRNAFYVNSDTATGEVASTGTGANATAGPPAVSKLPGAGSAQGSGPGNITGNPGVQGTGQSGALPSQGPLLTSDQAQAARTATSEYRQYKQAQKPMKGILQRQDYASGPYAKSDVVVPSQLWKPGPQGAQTIQQYLSFTKNAPESVSALSDAAAHSLQAKVQGGALSEKAFQAWRTQHKPALDQLEKTAPGTLARFENASTATTAMETAAAARTQAMGAYQKSVLGKVMNIDDPADITKAVGSTLKGQQAVGKMRQLAQEAAKDPTGAAAEGLRKSVADFMTHELVGNTEIGTSGRAGLKADAFQTFVRKNDPALREVLTPEEMQTLHSVAADLQRSARSQGAIKIPGGSDTAQNLAGVAKHGEHGGGSMLGMIMGGGLGHLMGHGAVGSGLGMVLGAIRKAGYGRVDDLVRDALLNPDLARTLMQKVPTSKGAGMSMANRLMRAATIGTVATTSTAGNNPAKPTN